MNEASRQYLVDIQHKLITLYDAEELQTLCFVLGIDYDSLRGGAKQTKVNSLIMFMGRNGRLPELVEQAREDRNHVVWPDLPEQFELPQVVEDNGYGTTYVVNTGGGTYVQGSVATGGGNFTGRDNWVAGDVIGGDQMELSGDFRGSVVNIDSHLEHAVQSIAAMPHGTQQEKAELARLIAQLRGMLAQAPPELAADAGSIARRVELLAEEAQNEKPDQSLITEIGDGLKRAARRLAPRLPQLLPLVGVILDTIRFMTAPRA